MKKCKKVGCDEIVKENKTFCSLSCSTSYKNQIKKDRSYYINSYENNEKKYLEEPKKCFVCNLILPYDQRKNKYCGHSCAAKINNKGKTGLKYKMTEDGLKGLRKSAKNNFHRWGDR